MEPDLKRKLAAILVADVVGYSRLIADDEEATLRRLETFRSIWQDCLGKTGGRIFNTAGDAVLAEFQSAVEAVRCAVDFQAQATAQNEMLVPERQMHFRIGITVGDVVERKGDLLGDGVNVAARLQTLAKPGGICVSSWVKESVANKLAVSFADMGDQTVKNIPSPIRAFLVSSGPGAKSAPMATAGSGGGDLLGWAVGSWKGMATVVGLAAVGVMAVVMLVSRLSGPSAPSAPVATQVKTEPTTPAAKSAKVEPVSTPAKSIQAGKTATAEPAPPAKTAASTPAVVTPTPSAKSDPAVRIGMLTDVLERELRPGARFKECETCPEMVVIPRTDFIMGSTPATVGHEPDEGPTRKVSFNTRIAVSRFAVTLGEYETFVALTGYRLNPGCRAFESGQWVERSDFSFRNPGFPQGPDHPVVCLNWNDAKAYADWMTSRMKAEYRLPTEAEREYFTRAGTGTLFWWGNDIAPARAGYDWAYPLGTGQRAETRRGTHPVNAFQANPWGLFQVHGNVSEWVEDCWNDNYRGAPTDGSAWIAGDCKRRVLRGGSWGYAAKDLRASYREGATSTNRTFNFGFRLVRVLR